MVFMRSDESSCLSRLYCSAIFVRRRTSSRRFILFVLCFKIEIFSVLILIRVYSEMMCYI